MNIQQHLKREKVGDVELHNRWSSIESQLIVINIIIILKRLKKT